MENGARSSRSSRLVPLLLATSFAGWLAAWAWATPFGGFPDERDHYLRALSVGGGHLVGAANPELDGAGRGRPPRTCCEPGSPIALWWVQRGAKLVDLRAELDPDRLPCRAVVPNPRQRCGLTGEAAEARHRSELTAMGTIEPAAYLLPGLLARSAERPSVAARLARAGSVVVSAALLALGTVVFWRTVRGPLALAGLVLAISPMVLFVGASPAPIAWEVGGAFAFAVGCLALTHPRPPPGRLPWAAVAAGGTALVLSRALGPLWLVVLAALAVLAGEGGVALRRVRAERRSRRRVVGLLFVAAATTVAWEYAVQPTVPFSAGYMVGQLRASLSEVPRVSSELVGAFGSADIRLPLWAYLTWLGLVLALAGTAWAGGGRRGRRAVVGSLACVLGSQVGVSAAIVRQYGFAVQGRHVLAIAVAVPLVLAAAATDTRAARSTAAGRWVVAVAVVAGAIHAVGWWRGTHVGAATAWTAGVVPTLSVVTALVCLAGAAWLAARPPHRPAGQRPLP